MAFASKILMILTDYSRTRNETLADEIFHPSEDAQDQDFGEYNGERQRPLTCKNHLPVHNRN